MKKNVIGKILVLFILAAILVVSSGEYELITLGYGSPPSYGGGYSDPPASDPPPAPPEYQYSAECIAAQQKAQQLAASGAPAAEVSAALAEWRTLGWSEYNSYVASSISNTALENNKNGTDKYSENLNRNSNVDNKYNKNPTANQSSKQSPTFDGNGTPGQTTQATVINYPNGTSKSDIIKATNMINSMQSQGKSAAEINAAVSNSYPNISTQQVTLTANDKGDWVSDTPGTSQNAGIVGIGSGSTYSRLPVTVHTTWQNAPAYSEPYIEPSPTPSRTHEPYSHKEPDKKIDEVVTLVTPVQADVPGTARLTMLDPYIRSKIYDLNEDTGWYEVTEDVPTKETLRFSGEAKIAIFDIQVDSHIVKLSIKATACSYAKFKEVRSYLKSSSKEKIYLDGVLIHTVDKGKTMGTYTISGNKAYTQEVGPFTLTKNIKDVSRSDVYFLTQSDVYAKQILNAQNYLIQAQNEAGEYISDIRVYDDPTAKINGPTAKDIGLKINDIKTPKSKYQIGLSGGKFVMLNDGQDYEFKSEIKAAQAAFDMLPSVVEKVEKDLKQALVDAVKVSDKYTNDIYHWEWLGLEVTTDFKNGTSEIKFDGQPITVEQLREKVNELYDEIPIAKNDKDGIIIKDHPNGTYKGVGKYVYTSPGLDAISFETNVAGKKAQPVPNDVIVLSPVHNITKIYPSTGSLDQRISKTSHPLLQLDETFKLTIDLIGMHRTDRKDYSRGGVKKDTIPWVDKLLIKIPFDVYDHRPDGSLKFIKGGTETEYDKSQFTIDSNGTVTFEYTIPVWAKEGTHDIRTRVKALNWKSDRTGEEERANLKESEYLATYKNTVDLIGKIYDLRVNNSTDVDWNGNVQSMGYNVGYVPANEFPFGNTRRTGTIKSQNKNPGYTYAPKLGYTFAFSIKSKGRKIDVIDVNVADDGFYFLSKANGQVVPVDLYCKSKDGATWLKIGKENNVSTIKVTPNASFLKVAPIEMTNSNRIYPIETVPGTPYNYSLGVNAGTLAKMTLPHNLRFCYDNFAEYVGPTGLYKNSKEEIINNAKNSATGFNPAETGEDIVIGSVGHWYAGYALPSSTVAVKKDTPTPQAVKALQNQDPTLTYRSGYIMVGMNITGRSSKRNGGTTGPINPAESTDYVEYTGPKPLDANGKEIQSAQPEIDWGADYKYNPNDASTYVLRDLPGVATKVKVPNHVIAMFESDYSTSIDTSSVVSQ